MANVPTQYNSNFRDSERNRKLKEYEEYSRHCTEDGFIKKLMKLYGVSTQEELINIQNFHIERLQRRCNEFEQVRGL